MTGKGNSSPGNANLSIGTQAGHDEYHQSDSPRKYFPQHTSSISPTHDAVIAPFRRYVHPPAPLLFSPVIHASPLVIPAQAGILTRGAISKGRTIVVTYHSFCKLIGQTGSSFGSLLVNTKKRPMSLTKRRANDDQ